jgi:hypothetical protein
MYGANKLGLFDSLASKMSSTAQPQPMVGGAGPRNTLPPAPPAAQPQTWDIHGDPSFGNFLGDGTAAPAPAAPAAAPSRNLTLEEAQSRMAGVTPVAGEMVGPPEMVGPRQPIAPSAAPNSAATKAVTATIQQLGQEESAIAGAAMPSRPVTPTPTGELRTGSGLPAYAGEGKPRERFPKEFKTIADVPKGYAFIPGAGPGTNTMRNLVGQAGYNEAVQLHGGPFGSHQEAVDFMDKYNAETRIGPPADRELRKSLGLSMPENTKGIPFKVPKAKVAGVAGAIVAMSDVANAFESAIKGDYSKAGGQAAGAAYGVLGPLAQLLAGTGSAGLSAEEEARQLRMRDYALKAGRGVAQGYDPRQLIGVAPPVR